MLKRGNGGEFMEKDRGGKVIAIVALLVGVVGLTIGFAAFSNTLTIQSSAEVNPDDTALNVDFSNENAVNKVAVSTNGVVPTLSPSNGPAGFTAETATIDNSVDGLPVISNLKATFTEPGQSVTYTFYTKNIGELDAYLKRVTMSNAAGAETFKTCTKVTEGKEAEEIADDALVAAACNGISLTFSLGSETFNTTTQRTSFSTPTAHDLQPTNSEQVTVVISYAAGSSQADGDFTVKFGDIQLLYSSVAS